MRFPHIAAAALLASLGTAQAQPVSETPGLSRDAARPNMPNAPGTNTPAGVVQGTVPPVTGQAGPQGTVPIAPSPGVPPQGEVRNQGAPAQTGLAPGDRARDAQGMGAGKPATSMPPGSVAGQAPGMGSTSQGHGSLANPAPGSVQRPTPGAISPGVGGASGTTTGGTTSGGTTPGTAPTR